MVVSKPGTVRPVNEFNDRAKAGINEALCHDDFYA